MYPMTWMDLPFSFRKTWKDPPYLLGILTISTGPCSIAKCESLPVRVNPSDIIVPVPNRWDRNRPQKKHHGL